MVQIEEKRLAELIKKANKYGWLEQLLADEWFEENLRFYRNNPFWRNAYNEYYKYDNMSDEKVVEDYLHIV